MEYSFSMGPEGDILRYCGGRMVPEQNCYKQLSPLLPLTQPLPTRRLRKQTQAPMFHQVFSVDKSKKFQRVMRHVLDPSSTERDEVMPEWQSMPWFKQMSKLALRGSAGEEECLFHGNCVRVTASGQIFYTGDDGVLQMGRTGFSETNPNIGTVFDIQSETEARFRGSRIYEINVASQVGTHIPAARYKYGITYFKYNEDKDNMDNSQEKPFEKLFSYPARVGVTSQVFSSFRDSCTLDGTGNISVMDMEKLKIKHSIASDDHTQQKGIHCRQLGKGINNNSVILANKNCLSLIDLRSTKKELFQELGPSERLSIVMADFPNVYVGFDDYINIYDLRSREKVSKVSLKFRNEGRLIGMDRVSARGHDCILSTNSLGELALSVLDFSHENCQQQVLLDDFITVECVKGIKKPDSVANVPLNSWRETVMRARARGGVWLDSCVENRFNLPVRGSALLHNLNENKISIFSVNSVGDIFGTQLALTDTPDQDSSTMEDDKEIERIVEDWGSEVFRVSQTKKVPVSRIFMRDGIEDSDDMEEERERRGNRTFVGMPPICPTSEEQNSDLKINLHISPDIPPPDEENQNIAQKSQDPDEGEPREEEEEENCKIAGITKLNLNYVDDISEGIIKIFRPSGQHEKTLLDSGSEGGDLTDHDLSIRPPAETDPDYALRSFLSELV